MRTPEELADAVVEVPLAIVGSNYPVAPEEVMVPAYELTIDRDELATVTVDDFALAVRRRFGRAVRVNFVVADTFL